MVGGFDDLSRDVYCLLGVPVDKVDMRETVERLDEAVRTKTPFLVSTPNVNFIVNAASDAAFRHTVVLSDLCIPDGMWFVRLGRMLGIPIKDRVAGADLLEALKLRRSSTDPVKVVIFGGSDAAGNRAREQINARGDGLQCAGSINPGFGSVEQMSAENVLTAVNSSQADFLLVALGAQKGQMWLHKNHARLSVPVRAHLGATVNFYSGAIKRAPRFLQNWGLEWAWRIKEEPLLWRRYAHDGGVIAQMFLCRVAPLLLWTVYLKLRRRLVGEDLTVVQNPHLGRRMVSLGGGLTASNIDAIASVFRAAISDSEDLVVDISGARAVDARFAGLLCMLKKVLAERGRTAKFVGAPMFIRWLLGLYGFELPGRAPESDVVAASGVELSVAE